MQGAAKGQGDTERAGIKMWNQNSEHSSSRESISRYNLELECHILLQNFKILKLKTLNNHELMCLFPEPPRTDLIQI